MNMKSSSCLLLSLLASCLTAVSSDLILESTAWIEVSYDTPARDLSPLNMYSLETATAEYFSSIVVSEVDLLLSTNVQITDISNRATSGKTFLDAIVTCLYIETVRPLQLDTIIMKGLNSQFLTNVLVNQTSASDGSLEFSIRPYQESRSLESVWVDNGRTKADKGLVLAVSLLTVVVVMVSSVLLYVTGGCVACGNFVSNCLFVEEDGENENDYAIEKRATFQVQSYDDQDGGSQSEASAANGGIMTNASGLLGDENDDDDEENPTMKMMGLQTPARNSGGGDDNDDSMMETPSGVPLGIQSVRKLLPPESPEVPGGLSHLILQRRNQANGGGPKPPPQASKYLQP